MAEVIPAPDAVKQDVAPTEKEGIQNAEQVTTSETEVSGKEEQQDTATEQDAQKPDKTDKDEKELTPAQLARKERNKQRWIQMKQRVAWAEAELARERNRRHPDPSEIDNPDDALATKTAIKVHEMSTVQKAEAIELERLREKAAMLDAWEEMKSEMRERTPDFDEVVNQKTPIHEIAAPFIVESDKGGELAYWLGKNRDVAEELFHKFETAPAKALFELGGIAARLSTSPPKSVTKAPKPAQTLGGGSNPPSFDVSSGSVSDFAAELKKAGVIR